MARRAVSNGRGSGISRRRVLGAAGAALAVAHVPAPCQRPRLFGVRRRRATTLRVLGTHVTLQERIRERAERDLGLKIEFVPRGSAEVLQQASTRPDTFDVYEQWSNSIRILWQARAIQAVDTTRIDAWSEINSLSKTGRLVDGAPIGAGDAPCRILFAQPDGSLGTHASQRVSFLPYVHNVDSFGYSREHVPEGRPYEEESWGWLLDDQWRGKVAIVNEPTIGIFDLALAAQAKGLMKFGDLGQFTRGEVDQLFEILIDLKQRGHFYGLWSSVPESVEFMRDRGVVVESMFSPAVADLNASGVPCHYAAPAEGYRAWHGVMCLSSAVDAEREDAAYRFMNWWLGGWPGAHIARQGYYISVPERSRSHLSAAEWDYWYDGAPATEDLEGTDGRTVVRAGESRRGGSYAERFSNVAVWNTVMDTYEYSLLRWSELVAG